MIRHKYVFTDKTDQSQYDSNTVLLLHQLSAGSWMSLGHQGGLTSTFSPTIKEGLNFLFYGLVGLCVRLNLL